MCWDITNAGVYECTVIFSVHFEIGKKRGF